MSWVRFALLMIVGKARPHMGLVLVVFGMITLTMTHSPAAFAQQDSVANVRSNQTEAVHPSVLLERRIQELIIALGITGEQEPPFRVAMEGIAELELAYDQGTRVDITTYSELLRIKEQMLAPVLYGHQISKYREIELLRMQQERL